MEKDRQRPTNLDNHNDNQQRDPDFDLDLGDPDVISKVQQMVSEEPRTVREVHETIASDVGLSRDQTEYRLEQMSQQGLFESKKGPGRTSPKIFWSDDTE